MPPALDLVISGGGTRGVAVAGAMSVLEQKLPRVRRVIGTSAGAIGASLGCGGFLSSDYLKLVPSKPGDPFLFTAFFGPPEGEQMRAMARQKDSETRKLMRTAVDAAVDEAFKKLKERRPAIGEIVQNVFNGAKQPIYEGAYERFLERIASRDVDPLNPRKMTFFFSLLETGGIFDPELFRTWLVAHMSTKQKRFTKATTLKEFHAMTRPFFPELSVVAADLTDARALVLNHRTAPHCPVVEAVLASLSVPFVWPESIWQKHWGTYLGQEIEGHALVDGAVLNNFPMHYVVNRDKEDVRQILGEPDKEPSAVIGLFLDASRPVPGDVPAAPKLDLLVLQRAERLLATMSAWQWDGVRGHEDLICYIGTKGHPSLELAQTPDAILRLQALVNSGRCAMVDYLKKRKL